MKDLIGIEFKSYSFEIEKGKIKELVQAIGDDNPIYTSLEAALSEGFQGIPIPMTFLKVIDLWGGHGFEEKVELLKLNPVKILNGEQEFELFGEIYAGDTIFVNSKVVQTESKNGSTGRMDLITTENQYKNQRGELVAVSRNVLVHRV